MKTLSYIVPAAFVIALAATSPAGAGGLKDALGGVKGIVDHTVSGATGAVGGVTGAVGGAVGGTVGGLTKTVSTTTTSLTGGLVNTSIKIDKLTLNNIDTRLSVLSDKKLLKLCLSVGASGCGDASRAKRISLIDARLKLLSGKKLLALCVSIGGSCGGGGKGTVPGGNPHTPRSNAIASSNTDRCRVHVNWDTGCPVFRQD